LYSSENSREEVSLRYPRKLYLNASEYVLLEPLAVFVD
jgi:hypothetical protein